MLFADSKIVYIRISHKGQEHEYNDDPSNIRIIRSSGMQHVDCMNLQVMDENEDIMKMTSLSDEHEDCEF